MQEDRSRAGTQRQQEQQVLKSHCGALQGQHAVSRYYSVVSCLWCWETVSVSILQTCRHCSPPKHLPSTSLPPLNNTTTLTPAVVLTCSSPTVA